MGFSFNNMQEEGILTSHWNSAENDQIIARGVRAGSHKLLQEEFKRLGLPEPKLDIYQYVAVPSNLKSISIDLKMYKHCEIKDRNIKMVEKILKESSIDCALNYSRNYIKNKDYERECEYSQCVYSCDDINAMPLNLKFTDYSSDIILYTEGYKKGIVKREVYDYFKTHFMMTINDIKIIADKIVFPFVYIVYLLFHLINEKITIHNYYNVPCFVRENKSIFYLTEKLEVGDDFLNEYYTRFPLLNNKKDYQSVVDDVFEINVSKLLTTLFSVDINDEMRIHFILNQFGISNREKLLEWCIYSQIMELDQNVEHRDMILTFFLNFYSDEIIDGCVISWLSYTDEENNLDKLRCFDAELTRWRDATQDEQIIFKNHRDSMLSAIKTNKYGYYGFLKTDYVDYTYKFFIVEISNKAQLKKKFKKTKGEGEDEEDIDSPDVNVVSFGKSKKNKKKVIVEDENKYKMTVLNKGQVCTTFNSKFKLINILYVLGVEPDLSSVLWNQINLYDSKEELRNHYTKKALQ